MWVARRLGWGDTEHTDGRVAVGFSCVSPVEGGGPRGRCRKAPGVARALWPADLGLGRKGSSCMDQAHLRSVRKRCRAGRGGRHSSLFLRALESWGKQASGGSFLREGNPTRGRVPVFHSPWWLTHKEPGTRSVSSLGIFVKTLPIEHPYCKNLKSRISRI